MAFIKNVIVKLSLHILENTPNKSKMSKSRFQKGVEPQYIYIYKYICTNIAHY